MNLLANLPMKSALPFVCLLLGVGALSSCGKEPKQVQLSEQPAEIAAPQNVKTEAREGRFSLRSRIAYSDIQTLIESEIPPSHTVENSRQLCKRIIGIKACGTANWNLNVKRQGELKVSGSQQYITVKAPIAFDGIVGMDGRIAKALGLNRLDVAGSVVADIKLGLTVSENWCPRISVSIAYEWKDKPTVVWRNQLDFSLEKVVNDARFQLL